MILGAPGSGKSTLARALGDRLGLPVVHMDQIHYSAGWTPRPHAEKVEMVRERVQADRWVFEGGMSSTYELRAARADLIALLDFPLVQRLYRVTWRTLRHHGRTRPDLPAGCPEQFDPAFFRWIVETSRRNRRRDLAFVASHGDKGRVLRTRRQVARFLDEVAP